MPSKLLYGDIKELVESKGFVLLSKEYTNSLQKLEIQCSKHGTQFVTAKWLRLGTGCFKCGQEVKVAHRRVSIDTIKNELIKNGYIPLFDTYKNEKDELKTECSKHGIFYIRWETIRAGSFCKDCGYERVGSKKRTPFEKIKEIVSKTSYSLVNETRINCLEKMVLNCNIHGQFNIRLDRLKMGQGCKKCGYVKSGNRSRMSHENFIKNISHFGYEIITTYNTSHDPITVRCPKHGIFTTKAYSLSNGHGCPACAYLESEPEKEILNFIKDLGLETVSNSRKIIKPLELDIFILSLNIAIEYNGLRWHSEKYQKNNKYHFEKMKKCNEKGIRLISIFADEWQDRKDQVKNYLMSVMGKNPANIGARKTDLKIVDKKESKRFLEENHIQGATKMDVAFGLYFGENLVGIMTGNEHHRQGHGDTFVLNRLAFKSGISVQGGSSKLLKALVSYAKEKGYSKLLSWSDNRWSEGRVYEKMGFALEKELGPDYFYTKQEERYPKQSNTKKNLLRKGAIGTMANTEKELALSLGLHRIFDCGKKAWAMDLK